MIWNIVDARRRRFRWRKVNAIVEGTCHDNVVEDSDQAPEPDDDIVYEARAGISLAEAIEWAQRFSVPVTLYLYDDGDGIGASPP